MAKNNENERIQEIARRRLLGEAVASIAADLGISRAYIYTVLGKFPKADNNEDLDSHLGPAEEFEIIMEYLSQYPAADVVRQHSRQTVIQDLVSAIADDHGLTEAEVYTVLYRMTTLHPAVAHFPYYSNIESWKIRKIISLKDFAKAIKVPTQELNEILQGWRHMPLKVAQKIKDFSGLSLHAIYSDLLEIDRENGEEHGK